MGNPEICFALLIGAVTQFFLHWNCWREFHKFLPRIMGLFHIWSLKIQRFSLDFRILFRPLPRDADLEIPHRPRSGPPKTPGSSDISGTIDGRKWRLLKWPKNFQDESTRPILGGGVSQIFFMFNPILGKMNPIGLAHIFQRSWFNHQLVYCDVSEIPRPTHLLDGAKKKLRIFKGEKLYQPQLVSFHAGFLKHRQYELGSWKPEVHGWTGMDSGSLWGWWQLPHPRTRNNQLWGFLKQNGIQSVVVFFHF